MSKRALIAAAVALVAALAAGCGSSGSSSSDTTPTSEWADGLCSAITTWTSSLTSIGTTIKEGGLTKDSLSSAIDDAQTSTDTFTSSLKGLGKPDTDAGQQAKDSVDQLATNIDEDMQTIQDAVANASGAAGVLTAVSTISTTLKTAGQQVSSTITGFQSLDAKGELETAFKAAPSCKDLGNGS
jgi:methyl-accepting chemotaxis protein